jgi:hypothetical protein
LGKPDTAVPLNSNGQRTVQGTVEGLGDAIPGFEIAFIPARTSAAAHVVAVSSKEFSMNIPEGEYGLIRAPHEKRSFKTFGGRPQVCPQ